MRARFRTALRAWQQFAASRPAWLFAVAAVFAAGMLALYARASTEQDMAALLPGGPGSPREAARLLSDFGALNTLLLDLEVPGASPDELTQRGAELTKTLRESGRFSEVFTGPDTQELRVLGAALLPHRLELLAHPRQTLESRLEPQALDQELASLKEQLAAPQALVMKNMLLEDPLGLNADLFGALQKMAGEVDSYRGQLISKDHHHVLLVTTPKSAALDTNASEALLVYLQDIDAHLPPGPSGPANLLAVGGPRFAAESAAGIKNDVVLTLLTSAVLLLALFVWRFRSAVLLLLVSLLLGIGVLGGLGTVVLFQGHINALTLGFGAVLIGVAVDYPIYLLNAVSAEGGTRLERILSAVRRTERSLFLGFITTFFSFVTLLASKFPGLRELALFAGAGIGTAFVATMFLLVPLAARFGPLRVQPVPRFMVRLKAHPMSPRWASFVTLGLVVASLLLLPHLRFDGELRHLDSQTPQTLREFDEVGKRFGLQGAEALVVSQGRNEEEALERNDAAEKAISAAESTGAVFGVRGITGFLPSVKTQASRAAELRTFDLSAGKRALAEASERAGFSKNAFNVFWNEVQTAREGQRPPLTRRDFEGTSLGTLVGRLLRCGDRGCIAVTSLTPRSTEDALALGRALPSGSTLLDGGALAANIIAELPKQLALLSALGLLVSFGLLAVGYRSAKLALLAVIPCCLGLLFTLGFLSLTRVPLNIISGSALVLVLGCGVDYGIFVLQEITGHTSDQGVESTGVMLASLSTLAGFGTLVLASHKALHSLGAAVGLGVLASAVSAIFILPGLARALGQRGSL